MDKKINAFLFPKINYKGWLESLMGEYEVWGPCNNDGKYKFEQVLDLKKLDLNYASTLLPPSKKIFHRPVDSIFKYNSEGGYEEILPRIDKKIIVFGIHPCDLHGLLILDLALKNIKGDFIDPYYFNRRENSIIVAYNCTEAGEYCFCSSWQTGPFLQDLSGVDLLFTDLGENYLVEVGSLEGANIAQSMEKKPADSDSFKKKEEEMIKTLGKFKRHIPADRVGRLIKNSPDHKVWKENGDICVSCGSCTNVCPTCFCFSVKGKLDWDFKTSITERHWASCQIYEFAEVAFGENFRSKRHNRVRQWASHKLAYSKDQYGITACVGCGRCIENCVVNIDISEIANKVAGTD